MEGADTVTAWSRYVSKHHKEPKDTLIDAEDYAEEYLVTNTVFIGSIQDEWYQKIQVGKSTIDFNLDTGIRTNVLPLKMLREVAPEKEVMVAPTKVILTAFGTANIKPLDAVIVPCNCNGISWQVKFYITGEAGMPTLGHNACEKMGIVKTVNALTKPSCKRDLTKAYPNIFSGLGLYEKECYIELRPEVEPVIQHRKRVTYPKRANF